MSNEFKLRLTQCLRTAAPVELQRLAQDMAPLIDYQRYKHLQVQGENEESQPTWGWPDAYVEHPDLTVDGVEATREKDGNWRKHLRDDLRKAADPDWPRLNGYLFVAGYPTGRARADELGAFRRQFRALGIPPERVQLFIGEGLVNELLKPQYAQALYLRLGLSRFPVGFEIITTGPPPIPSRLFEPGPAEYRDGSIFRPAIADDIETKLSDQGCALLLGRGAAGKSVLARLIATQGEHRDTPSYYLSLRKPPAGLELLPGAIENIMVEFGGRGVLFILDDVHLDEGLAAAVWNGWNAAARHTGTRLLLVGREVRRTRHSVWEELDVKPIILRAQAEEALGVYRRLMRQHRPGSIVQEPPPHELDKWLRAFGGDPAKLGFSIDLMALAAAIQFRRDQLYELDWTLTVQHARTEVRETYLVPLSEGERQNLLRLASLPDDSSLGASFLVDPYAGFSECLHSGLVFEAQTGSRESYLVYFLAHSALGKLLLAGAPTPVDPELECCAVASASGHHGLYLAFRAVEEGKSELARRLYEAILDHPSWLNTLPNVHHLARGLQLSADLRVPLLPASPLPAATRAALIELCLRSDLNMLRTFLEYLGGARSPFRAAYDEIVEDLENRTDALVDEACKTDAYFIFPFLQFASRPQNAIGEIYEALIAGLVSRRAEVAARVSRTNPHELDYFLRSCADPSNGLLQVYQATVDYLVENREELVRASQSWNPAQMLALLGQWRKAGGKLQLLYHSICDDILARQAEVTSQARELGINALLALLKLAQAPGSHLQDLHRALLLDIADSLDQVAARGCSADADQLDNLLRFCSDPSNQLGPLYRAIVRRLADIKEEIVRRSRSWKLAQMIPLLEQLRMAGAKIQPLYHSICVDILARHAEIISQSRDLSLGLLLALLKLAQAPGSYLQWLHRALLLDLADSPDEVAARICAAQLSDLPAFLSYLKRQKQIRDKTGEGYAQELWKAIAIDQWNRRYGTELAVLPTFPTDMTDLLPSLGRPELLEAPARAAVEHGEARLWHAPGIGMRHLADTIWAYGRGPGWPSFVERIAAPAWLDRCYAADDAMAVADALFAIAETLEPELHPRFVTAGLVARLTRERQWTSEEDVEAWWRLLAMTGSAALLGAAAGCDDPAPAEVIKWAARRARLRGPALSRRALQVWCGIYELVRNGAGPEVTSALEDQPAPTLAAAGDPEPALERAMSQAIFGWLDALQANQGQRHGQLASLRQQIYSTAHPPAEPGGECGERAVEA